MPPKPGASDVPEHEEKVEPTTGVILSPRHFDAVDDDPDDFTEPLNTVTAGAVGNARQCPECDQITFEPHCPTDFSLTLLCNARPVDPKTIQPGRVVDGRYIVGKVLGHGGFGCVFEAKHTGTGQHVALKILDTSAVSPIRLKRFFREARATAQLRSPNTVRVFDFGQDVTGVVYLACELLRGATLSAALSARRKAGSSISEGEAVAVGIAVARSLNEAHGVGLVHRDIKPDNIFLNVSTLEGACVKVLDFGIAKLESSPITRENVTGPGTPKYMSPEQIKGADVDGRSDLYSLAGVLYKLLSGRAPFSGDLATVLYHQISTPPDDIRTRSVAPVSDAFAEILHRLLSKNRELRPANAGALIAELEALASYSPAPSLSRLAEGAPPQLLPMHAGASESQSSESLHDAVSAVAGGSVSPSAGPVRVVTSSSSPLVRSTSPLPAVADASTAPLAVVAHDGAVAFADPEGAQSTRRVAVTREARMRALSKVGWLALGFAVTLLMLLLLRPNSVPSSLAVPDDAPSASTDVQPVSSAPPILDVAPVPVEKSELAPVLDAKNVQVPAGEVGPPAMESSPAPGDVEPTPVKPVRPRSRPKPRTNEPIDLILDERI